MLVRRYLASVHDAPPALTVAGRLPGLWWVRALLAGALLVNNAIGAIAVYTFAALVLPIRDMGVDAAAIREQNLRLAAVVVAIGMVIGVLRGIQITRRISAWIGQRRAPSEAERLAVLRAPWRLFGMQAAIWGGATVLFGLVNARHDPLLGAQVTVIVGIAGVSTCAFAYLLAERMLRPLAGVALWYGVPNRLGMRMGLRIFLAWLLGSGVLVTGLVMAGLSVLLRPEDTTLHQLGVAVVALATLALLVGGLFVFVASRAASDPVRNLREGVDRVRAGDLTARVPIYDGTELGILQAGFNDMVEGLAEREQLRDLFGRHVGDEVARAALAGGVALGGEVRRVAVLFVDIIGSTAMAADRPPEEVVALLNRFFDVVIDVVHGEHGWINKFEGDAALAVWGAPEPLADQEVRALRAARTLGRRLREEVPEIRAGVGVSAGEAVAGNVGAAQRYEYTVIGDPVNEAARLTELAKDQPSLVVANAAMLADDEADHWRALEPVVVRGRARPTAIAVPQ